MIRPSFVRRKFNVMLGVSTITMSVNYLVMLSGAIIVGNLVGPEGLAAVNVCSPAFGVAAFLAALLSVGSGLVFSHAMGAFEERRAAGVFSQNLLTACLFGVIIGLSMTFGGDTFMAFSGIQGEVLRQAVAFWNWQIVAMSLTPLVLVMEAMVYADGDTVVAGAAGGCYVLGSVGLSFLFTSLMGTAGGVGVGTSITMVLMLIVTSLHFFRKNNHLKFVRHWSKKDLLATFAGSMPDASIYLCWAVLILLINQLVVRHYDPRLLTVVALAGSVTEFSIVFDGVGEALIPLGGMYAGEGNVPALRQLANHSALVATLEGVVCLVLSWCLAPHIAPLFGISGEAADLLPHAIGTIRAMAVAMPFMGFLMMVNTHFLIVRHVKLAVSVTYVKDLIFPSIGAWLFGRSVFCGIWWGVAAGFALAAVFPFVWVWFVHGRRNFPWLIPDDEGMILDFSIRLTPVEVVGARDRIEGFLKAHKVSASIIRRVMLAVEDMGVLTAEKNHHSSPIAEYAVFLDKPGFVRLVTRDMGMNFDVNELTPHLASIAERRYLNTLNCNRSEYVFKC